MLFNSFEFLLFLPSAFLLYWFVFKSLKWQNLFVVCASYLFYGWWDMRLLGLIFGVTTVSFASGLLLRHFDDNPQARRIILWSCVVLFLGTLGLFKYFDFFSQALSRAAGLAGWHIDRVTLGLVLPIGISFYTFQGLAYTIDVYRRTIRPTDDALSFYAFISFFPQLVAGPIERASNLLPQFMKQRRFDYATAVRGMRLILWGLFKKMAVADNAAEIVNRIFSNYDIAGTAYLWLGAVLFTFQLYCDFSGYSDIAVGTARLFGIRLSRNFTFPLFARNVSEYWRRWHISLSTWLRDYLYFPLGGSRCSKTRHIHNLFITFIASGLWHGANYTFVSWGIMHAAMLTPGALRKSRKKYVYDPSDRRLIIPFRELAMIVVTFTLVAVNGVLFRSPNMHVAAAYLRDMLVYTQPATDFIVADGLQLYLTLAVTAVMLVLEWCTRHKESPIDFNGSGLWRFAAARWAAYTLLFVFTMIFAGAHAQFVYFQF